MQGKEESGLEVLPRQQELDLEFELGPKFKKQLPQLTQE